MSYVRDEIYLESGDVVLMKFIESFSFQEEDGESKVFDKLKDDYCFNIRTISGKEYTVSSKFLCKKFHQCCEPKSMAKDVYDRWLDINFFRGR